MWNPIEAICGEMLSFRLLAIGLHLCKTDSFSDVISEHSKSATAEAWFRIKHKGNSQIYWFYVESFLLLKHQNLGCINFCTGTTLCKSKHLWFEFRSHFNFNIKVTVDKLSLYHFSGCGNLGYPFNWLSIKIDLINTFRGSDTTTIFCSNHWKRIDCFQCMETRVVVFFGVTFTVHHFSGNRFHERFTTIKFYCDLPVAKRCSIVNVFCEIL